MHLPGGSTVKNLSAVQEPQEIQVCSLGQEDAPEEGMATHSSIPTWRIPWTEELGRLQSMESQRIGHDWSDLAHMCVYGAGVVSWGESFFHFIFSMFSKLSIILKKESIFIKLKYAF